MKIETENEVVLGNNKNQKKTFSIASSPKAFKILSSNIYKNKPRAVVRELSCNCLDAHKLNGNTRPFEIHAPTWLNAQFTIRDFGPGLSDEDIMNLYTTYFASTKDQSNEFIGALGLGSKSPFSYTDVFTVKSFFGGFCTTYSASMINGEPNISKIMSMASEEPTGLEITIPVRNSDVSTWCEEINYVLFTFKKDTYKVIGTNVTESLPDSFYETGYYEKESYYHGADIYAVYGNIVYPLKECRGIADVSRWISAKSKKLYIHFELGELDIQPSREELSFDDTTVANVLRRVEDFDKILREEDIQRVLDAEGSSNKLLAGFFVNNTFNHNIASALFKDVNLKDISDEYSSFKTKVSHFSSNYGYIKPEALLKDKKITSPIKIYNEKGKPCKYLSERNIVNGNGVLRIIFVEEDSKKTLPKVLKTATNIDKLYDVLISPEFVVGVDIVNSKMYTDAIAISEFVEVTLLKMSELHKAAEFPAAVKKDEVRPKSPNAVLYTKGDDGEYSKQDLFMTAKEVREFSGHYWVSYNGADGYITDVSKLGVDGVSNNQIFQPQTIPVTRTKNCPDVVYKFYPSAWKYLNKDTTIDVFEVVFEDIKETLTEFDGKKLFNSKSSNLIGYKYDTALVVAEELFNIATKEGLFEGYVNIKHKPMLRFIFEYNHSAKMIYSRFDSNMDVEKGFEKFYDISLCDREIAYKLVQRFGFLWNITSRSDNFSGVTDKEALELIDKLK